jgi:hypothetical protein
MMSLQEIESELLRTINDLAAQGLPERDVHRALELTKAGEPGVALENLCTQLFERDLVVSDIHRAILEKLGTQMGLKSVHWTQLRRK